MEAVRVFFHWPDGGVWGNLVASAVWVPVSLLGTHLLHRHHRRKLIKELREHQ